MDDTATFKAQGKARFTGMLSVGILSYNTAAKLRKCLESLHAHLPDVPVLVLDNASTDDSCAMVTREFSGIRLCRSSENLFFARGCNRIAELCTTPYVLLMNADVFLCDASIMAIVKYMEENPNIIATSPLIRDGARLWHMASGIITPWRCIARDSIAGRVLRKTRWFRRVMFEDMPIDGIFIVPKITNSCCVIRRNEFIKAGGFSCGQILYWTEEEFAQHMMHLGYLQAVYGKAVVGHEHGSSTGTLPKSLIRAIHVRDRIHYMQRTYGFPAVLMVEGMLMLRFQIWKSIADYFHLIRHYREIKGFVSRIGSGVNRPLTGQ